MTTRSLKKQGRVFYLHTIDGRPAAYVRGKQICFINSYGKAGQLARSLAQIRKEQDASTEWRIAKGYDSHGNNYGYRRVRLP